MSLTIKSTHAQSLRIEPITIEKPVDLALLIFERILFFLHLLFARSCSDYPCVFVNKSFWFLKKMHLRYGVFWTHFVTICVVSIAAIRFVYICTPITFYMGQHVLFRCVFQCPALSMATVRVLSSNHSSYQRTAHGLWIDFSNILHQGWSRVHPHPSPSSSPNLTVRVRVQVRVHQTRVSSPSTCSPVRVLESQ